MRPFSYVYGLLRLRARLPAFLRPLLSIEDARAYVRRRLEAREAVFLEKLDSAVFANPRSPYLSLLRAAGCERGDVARLVKQHGVEETLAKLRDAGVYVTLEEFKGRTPAVRGNQTFLFRDTDFDNPRIRPLYSLTSGGTRGIPTRIYSDLEYIEQSAHHWALWFAANDWLDCPLFLWWPQHTGNVITQLRLAKFGKKFERCFYPDGPGSLMARLATQTLNAVVRRVTGFPAPERVPFSEAGKVGDCLRRMIEAGERPCLRTSPSSAVRVSLVMQDRALSLTGATFILGGEPVTPTRKNTIEASGAKAISTYGFTEGGSVGHQCLHASEADDVHILRDAYAVIDRQYHVGNATVNALLLTALLPAAPKVLLNTEIGDEAILESRRCACLFDELGYFEHLHTIRSFEKLTGEGVTFVGSDLFYILEDALPKRFGGTLAHYQLIEEQDARGLARYVLRVSPEVGEVDEQAVRDVFLQELGRLRQPYQLMTALWAQAGSLRVERRQPLTTSRGKLMPFRALPKE